MKATNFKPGATAVIALVIGCTAHPDEHVNSDSTSFDTLGVIKPAIPDSSGVITTPPVKDSNAIMPDSAIK
jgi:hypothetical protein